MTEILVSQSSIQPVPIHALTKHQFADWVAAQPDRVRTWAQTNSFRARPYQTLLIPNENGTLSSVLLGLGALDDPLASTALADVLPEGTYTFADTGADIPYPLLVTGFAHGMYRYSGSRGNKRNRRLLVSDETIRRTITRMTEGAFLARDLTNAPANELGPEELEQAAAAVADRHKARFEVITGDALLQGFPLIHTVGRASNRPPRLVNMVWGDETAPKVTLVGKGVCFDTGGIDIKPAQGMELMKKDMGGAAHVLGLAHMIMAAGLPVRLRVLIPAVENSISSNAFRPGDVFPSRKGLRVEIGNTDAEGRLILADALAYADEEEPDLLIDMATLTGAARFALGPDLAPYYTNTDDIATHLERTAAATADPIWRMPLYRPYLKLMEPKVGDINNISQTLFAGSVLAALFLEKFVSEATRWLHFDIFAWNPHTRPGRPVGAEAQALRALYVMIEERYGKGS